MPPTLPQANVINLHMEANLLGSFSPSSSAPTPNNEVSNKAQLSNNKVWNSGIWANMNDED